MDFARSGPTPTDIIAFVRASLRARTRDRPGMPRYGETIWVRVPRILGETSAVPVRATASLRDGDWDTRVTPLTDNPKIRYCLAHWRDGLSWEEAGAVDFILDRIAEKGHFDHLRSRRQVMQRLDRLDRIFASVRRHGRIGRLADYRRLAFREYGGPVFHVSRDGLPIFGRAGNHRLGMALALDLPVMPAQLGVVHADALAALPDLRRDPRLA